MHPGWCYWTMWVAPSPLNVRSGEMTWGSMFSKMHSCTTSTSMPTTGAPLCTGATSCGSSARLMWWSGPAQASWAWTPCHALIVCGMCGPRASGARNRDRGANLSKHGCTLNPWVLEMFAIISASSITGSMCKNKYRRWSIQSGLSSCWWSRNCLAAAMNYVLLREYELLN